MFGAGSYFCRVREVLVVGVSFGAGSYFCMVCGVSRYWCSVLAPTSAWYVVSVGTGVRCWLLLLHGMWCQ